MSSKRHKHGRSERHSHSSTHHHSRSHSRSHHDSPHGSRAVSPRSANGDSQANPPAGMQMFGAPAAQVTVPWGSGAFLGPAVTIPIQGTSLDNQGSADESSRTSKHHRDKTGHRKQGHHHRNRTSDGGDDKDHRKRGHHHRDNGHDESGEVRGRQSRGHHQDRAEDSRHQLRNRSLSTHSGKSRNQHGNYDRHGSRSKDDDIQDFPRDDRLGLESVDDPTRDIDRGSQKYLSDGEIQSSCSNDDDLDDFYKRRGSTDRWEGRGGGGTTLYEDSDWERGSDRHSSRGGRGNRGPVLLEDRWDDGLDGRDSFKRPSDNNTWREFDEGDRRDRSRGGKYSSREQGALSFEEELREFQERDRGSYKSGRADSGEYGRSKFDRDLKRHDSYSDFGSLKRSSDRDRYQSDSRLDECVKGRSGALLIEDSNQNGPGNYLAKEKKMGRSGALLIEDKKESRTGALLIEDRNRGPSGGYLSKEKKLGRSGALLIEDKKESRTGALLIEDRKEGRSGALLIEDRNDGRSRTRLIEDGKEGRTGALLIEDRKDGRSGALLIEDRNNGRPRPLHSEDRKEGRTGALLIEDKYDGRARTRGGEDRNESRSSTILNEDRKESRSGAVLIEDRADKRSGSILFNDRDDSKSWQSRPEDKSWPSRSEDKSWPSRSDDSRNERKGRGGAQLLENRTNESRDASIQRSAGRSAGGQGFKRSWSTSNFADRRQNSRSPERESSQGPVKRRRRREPSEEPSAPKCVRSGTPPICDPTEEDYYIAPPAAWVRCSAADLYFNRDHKTGTMVTTKRMRELEKKFENDILKRGPKIRVKQEPYEKPKQLLPKWQQRGRCAEHHHHQHNHKHSESSSSSSSSDSESDTEEEWWLEEMRRKQNHPQRLHKELWYNDPGELNYGPLCRCSYKARKTGIRHDKYPGEEPIPQCDINSNNLDKLFHYKITVSPVTNFLTKHPTIIMFDGHEYMFEGFSIFTHSPIPQLPPCQVIRFNIVYTIHIIEEQAPENFSIRSLDMFSDFLFTEILELVDIDWKGPGTEEHCRRFHVMPRFARPFPENGKEVLSMNDILLYLLKASKPVIDTSELANLLRLDQDAWLKFVDSFRHMVVTRPGKKPSSIRIDQLDKQHCENETSEVFPLIIHHGLRPAQLSYAGDPMYKRKWREYMKFRHLIWCKSKPEAGDKEKLEEFEMELQKIRLSCTMKREVTVEIDSSGFLLSGIRSDICQHAMLLPVLFGHIRFHDCLGELERRIGYSFKDRSLLHLAMTHSSYKINYGTNHDHGRNSMSNCGSRQREFGDQRTITQHTRKRGLNILLRIMSKFGNKNETRSDIPHNERLEFLGDAVVEFITSIHLFYMFPFADEGEMTTYRGSLVQNNHLAVLADKLRLQDFLLYAHGPDLCNDSALKHAMANCFEALIGALFLDGGVELADKVFSMALFQGESDLLDIWTQLPSHPLIQDEPKGDRHWIANSPALQKLLTFEEDIGYEFQFMRLLAKALTQPNVGYNHLTLGHNQRLEFLGDTIMQLISSNYLFRHFPDHHEGHLTLLRSSLVNNKTQAIVADELGLTDFVISAQSSTGQKMKQKERADLLESLFGAMYVDGGLEPCKILCDVCIFPRLEQFILNQDWNDPKSQLQQCCLTLRDMNEESPAVPVYKVLKKSGPANTRRYTVGVYFRGKRLAVGEGGSIQQGEMEAAEAALTQNKALFPNRFRFSDKLLKSGLFRPDPEVKESLADKPDILY